MVAANKVPATPKRSARPVSTGGKEARPEPDPREAAAIKRLKERWANIPARSRVKVTPSPTGGVRIENDGNEQLYSLETFTSMGSDSGGFLGQTLGQICKVIGGERDITTQEINAALAVMAAVEPENEVEALIGAQIVMANNMAVKCMVLSGASQMLPQTVAFGNLAVKFMRTTTLNVEALAKLRRKGEQVVKHVHVHEGGQAVVADTFNNTQGGDALRTVEQSQATEAAAGVSALPRPDEAGFGVPMSGNAERSMSDARGD
jgi:hypothetical protein